jgi:4-carboxymuconolactone decarboxylase
MPVGARVAETLLQQAEAHGGMICQTSTQRKGGSVDDRYERGREYLARTNERGAQALERLAEIHPDLERVITSFAYGDIYSRPGLDLSRRQLVTIALLTGLGDSEPQLEAHVHVALDAGVAQEELLELMLHCVTFVGVPRVLNAMRVVRRVLESRGASSHPRKEGA